MTSVHERASQVSHAQTDHPNPPSGPRRPTRREVGVRGVQLLTGLYAAKHVVVGTLADADTVLDAVVALTHPDNKFLIGAREQLEPGKDVMVHMGRVRLQVRSGNETLKIRNAPSADFDPSDGETFGDSSDVVERVEPEAPVDLLNVPLIEGADTGSASGSNWGAYFEGGEERFFAQTDETKGNVDTSKAALAKVRIEGRTPDGNNLIGTRIDTGEIVVLGIRLPNPTQPK